MLLAVFTVLWDSPFSCNMDSQELQVNLEREHYTSFLCRTLATSLCGTGTEQLFSHARRQ